MNNLKWHYYMTNGYEFLVLGYNPERDNVLCVGLHNLHKEDQKELLRIVETDEAQKEAYLVAILARHPYAGGGTWWERLQPYVFFRLVGCVERCGVAPRQIKVFRDKFVEKNPGFVESTDISRADLVIDELVPRNSTHKLTKTENIDDILFGAVLSEEDRNDIAIMKYRAGI